MDILVNSTNQFSSIDKVIKGKSKVILGESLNMEDQKSSGPNSIIPLSFNIKLLSLVSSTQLAPLSVNSSDNIRGSIAKAPIVLLPLNHPLLQPSSFRVE